jgi:hypothetical protein
MAEIEGRTYDDSDIGATQSNSYDCTSPHLLLEWDSLSSYSVRLPAISIDSELEQRVPSKTEPCLVQTRFLSPSPTKSKAFNNIDWEFPSPRRSEEPSKRSTERTKSDTSIFIMEHHTSASIITTSLEPTLDPDTRSHSATPVIPGIFDALPDVLEVKASQSPSKCFFENAQPSPYLEDLDDDWMNDTSDSGSVCLVQPSSAFSLLSQSRRGSELLPPTQMWITGGPCPGLYIIKGKAYGRPRWLGAEAQVSWNPDAKAWLLISRNEAEVNSALAMLCVDSNNPCITSSYWRVGKLAKRGIGQSFYDTYAFRNDLEMTCSKYLGSESGDKWDDSLIRESSVVKTKRGIGVVRFVGPLEDKKGLFAGIELFTPTGLNNGTMNKFFYFEAKPQHGVFVRLPEAIKEVYGRVPDSVATFMEDLLLITMKFIEISEAAIERLARIMIVFGNGETLFCRRRPNVLGIILFYELLLL